MSESSSPSPFRNNSNEMACYLTEILAKDDFPAILRAFSTVLRAQNVSALSRATGLRRDRLYKTFNGEIEPDFHRVLKLLDGLDLRLVVVPRENPKPKPELPKLGRPRTRSANKGPS
jgi:probable addiction module antidote protein